MPSLSHRVVGMFKPLVKLVSSQHPAASDLDGPDGGDFSKGGYAFTANRSGDVCWLSFHHHGLDTPTITSGPHPPLQE